MLDEFIETDAITYVTDSSLTRKLMEEQAAEKAAKKKTVALLEQEVEEDEDSEPEMVYVKVDYEDIQQQWDCESIVSMYFFLSS